MRNPYSNDSHPSYGGGSNASALLGEATTRSFMQKVYAWMACGLALTGGTAFAVASSPTLLGMLLPVMMPLMLVQFGVVIAFSFMQRKASGAVAGAMFIAYSLLTGVTFSTLLLAYTSASVASAFFITGGTFAALSVFATVTKKDLSGWFTFLFIGLIGVVIASVVNIFFHSGMLSFVVNCVGVIVFGGLTAYHTQMLRRFHADSGFASASALAISGALMLYLNFVNLFLSILSLTGSRRS